MPEARYLYCLTNRMEQDYGNIGLDNNRVYSIFYKDVAAVVHDCESKPYESKNVEKAKDWILVHNHIIETVMSNIWETIPFSFDTIIKDERALKDWLDSVYQKIKQEFQRLSGRLEYGIDIFLPNVVQTDFGKINSGKDYLLKKRRENLALEKLAVEAALYNSEITESVKDAVKYVQKRQPRIVPEGFGDKIFVASFSCLANQEEVKKLGSLLDEINKKFVVRFTGPWPPYSFVNSFEVKNEPSKK